MGVCLFFFVWMMVDDVGWRRSVDEDHRTTQTCKRVLLVYLKGDIPPTQTQKKT